MKCHNPSRAARGCIDAVEGDHYGIQKREDGGGRVSDAEDGDGLAGGGGGGAGVHGEELRSVHENADEGLVALVMRKAGQ